MKNIVALCVILLLTAVLAFFAFFILSAGEHYYSHSDKIYRWFYTPDSLKKAPLVSKNIDYTYSYNIDTQEMRVVITYRNVKDIEMSRQRLLDFIGTIKAVKKYNCSWIYHNPDDYAHDYQRYCVYKKGDSLELELYETS